MKVSVIIVSYNTKQLLGDCLKSFLKWTNGIEKEVIVVDNASTDGSQEMVKKTFPQVKLIANGKNLGFAAGNNLGLRKAQGEYLLLLNSDTKFTEDSLSLMLQLMEKNSQVGIASCQLKTADGHLQPTGGFFPNLVRVFAWMFFVDDLPVIGSLLKPFHPHSPDFYLHNDWYRHEHLQDWVTGAFFLIRQRVLKDIGLLDENFFMYVEEMELCYRAKKAGWQVLYSPQTSIIHYGGQSGTTKGALLGEYKGLSYFFKKHYPFWETCLLRLFMKAGALLRVFIFGIIGKNSEVKTIYVEASRLA